MKTYLIRIQVLVYLLFLITLDLNSQPFTDSGFSLQGVYGGSSIWGDYDKDGFLDILLIGAGSSKVYRNVNGSSFSLVATIVLPGIYNGSADWGDYDNDGDLDLLITGWDTDNFKTVSSIYRNNGDHTFTLQSNISLNPVNSGSAKWGDYNNDGKLDILLTGSMISKIYRNDGSNMFTEQKDISLFGVSSSSVAWGDYDNDGDLDILLTGQNSYNQKVSKIYRNNGNSTFTEQTGISLTGIINGSVAWGDYDNDGYLDILLAGSSDSGPVTKIYKNSQDGTFSELASSLTGLINSSVSWGDYNNDGKLDILIAGFDNGDVQFSKIYQNNGSDIFTERDDIVLTGVGQSSVAWGDYDNDYDLDILLTGVVQPWNAVSKVYSNGISSDNNKPSSPTGLLTYIINDSVSFTFSRSTDNETSQIGLSYNMYIYENGKPDYKSPPHAFRQTDAKNGKRLIAKSGNIQWSSTGFYIKNLPPEKTYYWSVQSVDAGLQGSNFSTEQNFTVPLYRPTVQAGEISFSNLQPTQATVNWANGGGTKRVVFIKTASSGTADPSDNTVYNINDFTVNGWKCIYNGTGNSVLLTGIVPNTDYLLHVCEYNGTPGNEKYLKSSVYNNPNSLNTVFIEQTSILPGTSNGSVSWGNFDKDTDLDLLLTGDYQSRVFYYGSNTFTEQTSIVLPGTMIGFTALGDYDNDNDIDILLTGGDMSGWISKICSNNGNNTFTEQTGIKLTGVIASFPAWGDYDNDGDMDIIITGYSSYGRISEVYRNNGNNSYSLQTDIKLPGVDNSSVAFGDYDNDDDLDILLTGATAEYPHYPISRIYRNNGNNNFDEQSDIILTGVYGSSVDWGDYNNDGCLDILLSGKDLSSHYVTKIYRNEKDNSFSEQTGIHLPGVYQGTVAWGDYDNDGDLDILITGQSDAGKISKIFRNNGNNSFAEQISIRLPGVDVSSVAWGDYDADGDLDIILTGATSSGYITKIYKNEILTHNVKPSVPDGLNSYWENDHLVLRWKSSSDNSTPKSGINYNIRVGTTPGGSDVKTAQTLPDGTLLFPRIINLVHDTTINLKYPFNKYYWSVQAVDKGGLASGFATEKTTPLDSIQAKELEAVIKSNNSILVHWKNGNGLRRSVFGRLSSPTGVAIPVNNTIYQADPSFGKGEQIGTSGWFCLYNGVADSAMVFGLSDGYSYDIQVIEYIEVNDKPVYFRTTGYANPGIFSSSIISEQTGMNLPQITHEAMAWGDYDKDGYLDLLLTGSLSGVGLIARIYNNDGTNTFSEQTGLSLNGVWDGSVAWGDYNKDGYLDILISGREISSEGASRIYLNNKNNTFSEQTGINLTGVIDGAVAWGDYDNDGNLDILLTGYNQDTFTGISKIYHNNGDNTFTEQKDIVLCGVYYSAVEWGDYDNDGDLDIILTGTTGSTSVTKIYKNNGHNTFAEQTGISLIGVRQGAVSFGDYDNDGDLDILLTGRTNESVQISKIYRNCGDNSFSDQTDISLDGTSESSAAWGDYDNDGDLDIILTGAYPYGKMSKIYRNDGNNKFVEESDISVLGIFISSSGWGDYDNDGDLDLFRGPRIYRNNMYMKAGNYLPDSKPSSPSFLTAESQPYGIRLSWAPVRSDETSYKTITYNVGLGTSRTKSDILMPHSDTGNGDRHIVAMGNAELDTSFIVRNLSAGKYYWGVQAVDQAYIGGEWSVIDSFEVKNIQAFFSSDEVCLGYPIHFTDQSVATTGIASWKWDFNDGNSSTGQNPVHTYSASGTFNVKLVVTDTDGAKDSLTQAVVVRAKPVTDFTAPAVCQGTATSLTNSTETNGLTISSWFWDFGDGQTSIIQQPPAHGYLGAADYTVLLKALASNGCRDSITKTVTVANYPVAVITSSSALTFCKGDSVTLSVTQNNDYFYNWKLDGALISETGTNKLVAKLSGNYTVDVINSKGNCKAISSPVSIVAQNAPAAPSITYSGNLTFCQGDSIILSVANTTGYSYQWKLNGGTIGTNSSLFIAKNTGTYNLVVSNSSGCSVASANSVTVTVNSVPVVPALGLEGKKKFCAGEIAILSVPVTSGYTYSWKNADGIIGGAAANSYTVTTSGEYKLEVSNAAGCKVTTEAVTIEVSEKPLKPAIDKSGYTKGMCLGESPLKLSVDDVISGYNYRWYKNEAPLSDKTSIEVLEDGNYYLEANTDICASSRDSVNIDFRETLPKPLIIARGPSVWYLSTASKANHYKWYYNGAIIPGAEDNSYVAGQNLGIYRLSISNDNQCFAFSDSVRIPTGLTGIEDTDPFKDVRIYPNPTTGMFTIEMNNNVFGELVIDIITQNGSKILNIKFDKSTEHFMSQIDLSGQPNGMYLVNLSLDKFKAVKKVLVE